MVGSAVAEGASGYWFGEPVGQNPPPPVGLLNMSEQGGQRPPGYESRDPATLETSVPGIFAAGDVRATSAMQVATAAGEGAAAALMIRII